MRLFLIENYIKHEFDVSDADELDALITFAKENCSRALKEFFQTGHYLHRGLSGIDGDHAYVVPTKEKREPFGPSTKGKTGASFNSWLSKNGHVRRDKKAAFATTSTPKFYKGITNDAWFYFLPVGNYHYTYLNTVQGGDFNLHSWVQKSLGKIKEFEDDLEELESNINYSHAILRNIKRENPDMDFDSMVYVPNIIGKFDEANKLATQLILDGSMLYQKGIFADDNLDELFNQMRKVKEIFHAYSKAYDLLFKAQELVEDESDEAWLLNHSSFSIAYEKAYETIRLMFTHTDPDEVETITKGLLQSFATDTITPHIEDNEVFFQCDTYLAIPYSLGEDFIKKLLG